MLPDPPTYAESVGGAVDLCDDDDDDDNPTNNMGDLTYTPMYTYVYDYRPPPAYHEVFSTPSSGISSTKPWECFLDIKSYHP